MPFGRRSVIVVIVALSSGILLLLWCLIGQKGSQPPPELIWGDGLGISLPQHEMGQAQAALEMVAKFAGGSAITIDYPMEGTIFPAEIVAPQFQWHDADATAKRWLVEFSFAPGSPSIFALVNGPPPQVAAIDPRCTALSNQPPCLKPDEATAHCWQPQEAVWEAIKKRAGDGAVQVTIRGFSSSGEKILSQGSINIKISSDPIGGVIFYRDVPLMPTEGQDGKIEPLAEALIGLIDWRLKDISRPDSKVVLRDMPTCANCHSFSAGGKTLGMDVDGPTGDKGAYAVADIRKEMTISPREIMTWNSWQDKARTGKTIGFLSQISPDGQFVLSTVNESLYVVNFAQYDFLQVFYPTRGIIACYDRTTGTIKPLPGANDPAMVQCSPVWSPDGKWVVFSRAAARDPFPPGQKMPQRANDPDELPMRYDLYKVPFNQGAGGQAQPIAGACDNGMSNTFPKISPDGKWIVFVKCRNGQLMRPDSELWIVPLVGGQARRMRCNMSLMNSWHSFSPNGRWMVFSSKSRSPYTQMFLTHIDKNGMDSPPVRVTGATAANRAVNIPEFVQVKYADLDSITIPSLEYWRQYKRGLDLAQRDRHADAVECFRRALAVDPGSARIQASLADSLTAISQLGEAVEYYDRAVAGEPQNFVYLSNRGNALLYLGQLDRALADFDTSISIRPGYAVAHANRGSVLARRQEYGQAMAAFSESLRLKPDQYWVWCNRGILKEMVDDDKGAAEDLIKCLDLAPPEWPQRADVQRRLQELRVRVGSK